MVGTPGLFLRGDAAAAASLPPLPPLNTFSINFWPTNFVATSRILAWAPNLHLKGGGTQTQLITYSTVVEDQWMNEFPGCAWKIVNLLCIFQPANRPASPSVNQSLYQSISQSICQSICKSICQLIFQSVSRSICLRPSMNIHTFKAANWFWPRFSSLAIIELIPIE